MKVSIKNLRKNSRLSVEEVAKELNVHPYTIYGWERGDNEPRVSQAIKLCELYGCLIYDVQWLDMNKNERQYRKERRKEQRLSGIYEMYNDDNKKKQ